MGTLDFVRSPHPKIMLVPFIALVLFFSILIFVLFTVPLQLAGYSVVTADNGFYSENSLVTWLGSCIIGIPASVFYLDKIYKHFSQHPKKNHKTKKEELGATNMFLLFFVGLPFGFFIRAYILSGNSIAFEPYPLLMIFAFPVLLPAIVWSIPKLSKSS